MIGQRIKELRVSKGLTLKKLGEILNLGESTMSMYENGRRSPDYNTILRMSELFEVSTDFLLGKTSEDIDTPVNIFPLRTKAVPLLGDIVAGQPKFIDEEFQYFIEIDDVIKADFCLKVKGDSMINARIYDGDIVFVKKQADVEDGEIAVIRIDDEATLKRAYKMPGRIQLRAENPAYDPINITEEDHKEVEILGKAVAFQSRVR